MTKLSDYFYFISEKIKVFLCYIKNFVYLCKKFDTKLTKFFAKIQKKNETKKPYKTTLRLCLNSYERIWLLCGVGVARLKLQNK